MFSEFETILSGVRNQFVARSKPIFEFSGRTDLTRSLSRAKFDEEADFEVRFAVALQNPHQICEKTKFSSELFCENKLLASKFETLQII